MTTLTRVTRRAFGRRAVPDPRDLRHLLSEQRVAEEGSRPSRTGARYRRGPLLFYPTRPMGVACALLSALQSAPRAMGPNRCPSAEDLDHEARAIEGALSLAVTLRSGCKALRRRGLIERYLWAYDADDIKQHLWSGRGGLVLGLDWYAGMSHPDATGLIRAVGPPEGGHAVFAWGYDLLTDTVLIQNCWGPDWGGWHTHRIPRQDSQKICRGCARLPLEDLHKLLMDNGEAVALLKPAPPNARPETLA